MHRRNSHGLIYRHSKAVFYPRKGMSNLEIMILLLIIIKRLIMAFVQLDFLHVLKLTARLNVFAKGTTFIEI